MERYTFLRWENSELLVRGALVSPEGQILDRSDVPPSGAWTGIMCGKTLYEASRGRTDDVVAKVDVSGRVAYRDGAEVWEHAEPAELRIWLDDDNLVLALDLAEHARQAVLGEYGTRDLVRECLDLARSVKTSHKQWRVFTDAVWRLQGSQPRDSAVATLHLLVEAVYATALSEREDCCDHTASVMRFTADILGLASTAKYATECMQELYEKLTIVSN